MKRTGFNLPLAIAVLLGAVSVPLPAAATAPTNSAGRIPPILGVQNLSASATDGGVLITWQTEGAAKLVAFQILRAPAAAGPWTAVHTGWLTAAPGQPAGYSMQYLDAGADAAGSWYRLRARTARGTESSHGPVAVTTPVVSAALTARVSALTSSGRTSFRAQPLTTPQPAGAVALAEPQPVPLDVPAGGVPSRLKIMVRDTGLYFLSVQNIADRMGWSTNDVVTLLTQHQLRLSSRGRKLAYALAPADSGLYFFVQAQPDLYSGEEVIWLENGRGLVLPSRDGSLPTNAAPAATTFVDTTHFESNMYDQVLTMTDPESDYWFWLYLVSDSTSVSTDVPARLPAADGEAGLLTVSLMAVNTQQLEGEHHVIFSLNGTQVGEAIWEGITSNTASYPIPAGVLSNGLNQVTFTTPPLDVQYYSYKLLDWFEIQYPRSYTADGDCLRCPGPVAGPVTATGFSSPDVLVFDVSEATLPCLVAGAVVQSTNSAFAVSFWGAGTNASYFICTRSAALPATNLLAYVSAGLRSANNQANYLAFSVPALTNELARLITYRQGGGWMPQVVLTQQAYDEFNYGRLSPYALKRCLAHALAQWAVPPTHVLLAGTGNYDYRDYGGFGECLVPTLLTPTPDGMYASDNRLADVLGDDGVPEFALGRLPALTPAVLSNLIDKTLAYDSAAPGAWTSNVVFAADNPDEGGAFTTSSESVAALLPAGLTLQRAYLETQTLAAARSTLISGLNAGLARVNYFGHGGWQGLAEEGLLTTYDLSSLTNRITPGILTAMTCLINRFEVPGYPCFSESLLGDAPGGVSAVWSATGLSYNDLATVLDQAFYRACYQPGAPTMGAAVRQALQAGQAQGVQRFELDIMALLGDPALKTR